jgi:PAS domain-containing protein
LPPKTLLPDFLFQEGEQTSVLVHPLNVEGLNGFILLEQSTEDWVAYHEFAEHLGAALRGVRALWKAEEQASHLAATAAQMRNEVRERRQAEERLASSVAGLRGILAAANELMQVTDSDTFYRRAVELAREQLGLERCGFWVQMVETDRIRGTFGTNRQGRTVDESYVVRPKGPAWREMERKVEAGEPHWVKLAGHPHMQIEEARLVEIGHGWVVATPVFAGRKLLGAFYNDTALSGAPLDEARQELVFVYCAMLGSLMLSRSDQPESAQGAVSHQVD